MPKAVVLDDQLNQLDESLDAVEVLIANIHASQWSAPTPCTDWTVRRVVGHVVGMNRVFAAMLADEPPPSRGEDPSDDQWLSVYRDSASALMAAFRMPGVLDRIIESPLGSATGLERLRIRLYDLLAHGWDIAQATGQPADLPKGAAEHALTFAMEQVREDARAGRFGPVQPAPESASAIERLVAFLGRPTT